ncbi:MAG: copper amine oxidase N-terminal domain-containing protein [Clostridiales bacterium]|nr:copper amine oxidase N-terminal domain-containing protein [Clostridiales bacterium]
MKKKIAFLLAALMLFSVVPFVGLSAAVTTAKITLNGAVLDGSWADKTVVNNGDLSDSTGLLVSSIVKDFKVGDKDVEYVANGLTLRIGGANGSNDALKNVNSFTIELTNAVFLYDDAVGTGNSGSSYDKWVRTTNETGIQQSGKILLPGTASTGNSLEGITRLVVDGSRMDVYIDTDASPDEIEIPISLYLESNADVTLRIGNANIDAANNTEYSQVSGTITAYRSGTSGQTKLTAAVQSGTDRIKLKDVTVSELTKGVLKGVWTPANFEYGFTNGGSGVAPGNKAIAGIYHFTLDDGYQFVGVNQRNLSNSPDAVKSFLVTALNESLKNSGHTGSWTRYETLPTAPTPYTPVQGDLRASFGDIYGDLGFSGYAGKTIFWLPSVTVTQKRSIGYDWGGANIWGLNDALGAFTKFAQPFAIGFTNEDYNELYVLVAGALDLASVTELVFDGLYIEPENDDAVTGEEVNLTVESADVLPAYENYGDNDQEFLDSADDFAGITKLPSNVKDSNNKALVARYTDFGYELKYTKTADTFTKSYSGRKEVEIKNVTFTETAPRSWASERIIDFTLVDAEGVQLEGAKFQKFKINDKKLEGGGSVVLNGDEGAEYEKDTDNAYKVQITTDYTNVNNNLYNEILEWFSADIKLNIAAGFVGDVYLQASGRAIQNDTLSLKIAEITAPITIDFKITAVPIGVQTYPISDLTITETVAGALKAGKTLVLGIDEFAGRGNRADVTFNPVDPSQISVTETGSAYLKINPKKSNSSEVISIPIRTASKTASTIVIEDVAVKIYGDAPQGYYDLYVNGESWVETSYNLQTGNNWDALSTRQQDNSQWFGDDGLTYPDFIQITNTTPNAVLAKNVLVEIGGGAAWVDGRATTLSATTFLDTTTNRTMLPVYAISQVFGISPENVIWSQVYRTVTLLATNNRTIKFTIDSDILEINNVQIPMADANGVSVKAIISNGADGGVKDRTYVPFSQLALAFGVPVLWIPGVGGDASLVALNPTAEQYALAEKNLELINTTPVEPAPEEPAPEEPAAEEPAAE